MNNLTIGDFEGPLDLLLHLVKQSKIEISEIKIVDITEKYLDFITQMESINLDIASEYLVVASELIEMKSRCLLPSKKDTEESEYEENPEEELKRRLLEYQKYKESTKKFKELENKRSSYFTKPPESIKNYTDEKISNTGEITVNDLLEAFQKLLERKNLERPIKTKITRKELSVRERVVKIRDILKKQKRIMFIELFDDLSKPYVVVTFLSVLEMARNKEILLKQNNNFGDIYLERVD